MVDSETNIPEIRLFIVEFKRAMLICILLLISISLGIIVRSYYPQTAPLSFNELQETLPPLFFVLHFTAQITSFLVIFFAGYFIAAYRIERKTRKYHIQTNSID
ncbi:MAG: hypothetical protein ACW991_07660 [Candidatus Hodarchaeales archaeon]|jgi:hypothetical protein